MDILWIIDKLGENWTLVLGGAMIGAIFGAFAQQTNFCLRAAAIEFARGTIGNRTAIWLLVFTAAVLGTQILAVLDVIATREARQIASPQSLSGALIGGLMFGTGMVLARGCSSRLLVLSATGNLRALLSGLVFAVFAQASLKGVLSPIRETIAGYQSTSTIGGNDLLLFAHLHVKAALFITGFAFICAIAIGIYRRTGLLKIFSAICVGLTVPLAWWFTTLLSGLSFEPVQMEGITFTGPSADTLMMFLTPPGDMLDFSIGLVPGVFIGAFIAAAVTGQLQLQGFEGGQAMKRYLLGAALMGFGGMLAGGCAVGAGITGASVFALTAWITLFAIWLSAGLTDLIIDRKNEIFGKDPKKPIKQSSSFSSQGTLAP